jgi:hypothetical protein
MLGAPSELFFLQPNLHHNLFKEYAIMNKTIALITTTAVVASLVVLPGCNRRVENFIESIDGLNIFLNCDLDADFNASNCRVRGRVIRKAIPIPYVDLGEVTLAISSANGLPVTLPAAVTLTITNGGQSIAVASFPVSSTSTSTVVVSDPVAANSWLAGYANANYELEYEFSGIRVPLTIGQNTVSTEARVFGTGVAGNSYSTYVSRLRVPMIP